MADKHVAPDSGAAVGSAIVGPAKPIYFHIGFSLQIALSGLLGLLKELNGAKVPHILR